MTSAQYDFLRDVSSNDMLTLVSVRIMELEDKIRRQGPKWHDLRSDPCELPPDNTTVLDESGDKITYIGEGKWILYSEYYEANVEANPPIAWCECPIYNA